MTRKYFKRMLCVALFSYLPLGATEAFDLEGLANKAMGTLRGNHDDDDRWERHRHERYDEWCRRHPHKCHRYERDDDYDYDRNDDDRRWRHRHEGHHHDD